MSTPVVKVENLVKRYKELVAVDHFNLTIEEGEILGLLGPNGSGKTTTINCILSLLTYDKGSIEVFGEEMKPDSYELKRRIGVVMQNVAVFDELTVYENIDYFCGLYIKDKALRKQYVEEAIAFVNRRPKPLALYLFTENRETEKNVLEYTSFGGGCINDTIIHLATSQMGFGGVGNSGMGSYHGKKSFETFSHEKSIVKKYTWMDLPMRYQPYTGWKEKLVRMFVK